MFQKSFKPLLIFALFLCIAGRTQTLSNSVVASTGTFATAPWGSLSYTVGESIVTTLNGNPQFILTQGFQQPYVISTGMNLTNPKTAFATLYPNPSDGKSTIHVSLPIASVIHYQVYDVNAKEISNGSFNGSGNSKNNLFYDIDLSGVSPGLYFIFISDDNNQISQTLKFQIIN